MKKRIGTLLTLMSIALAASVISFAPKKADSVNTDGSGLAETFESDYNPVFYPAVYSTDIIDEPKYLEQKAKTFDDMGFTKAPSVYRGENVKVAVIDSGINYSHEDLPTINSDSRTIDKSSGSWLYYPFSSYSSKMNDTHGHGTHVASVIASQINGLGCAGVAPNVDLYVYKVTNTSDGYEWTAINNALQYCIDNHVDVINMSFQAYEHAVSYNGSSMGASVGCSTVLYSKINECYNAGITLVGAAGNYNTNEPSYPASNDHVISVGSFAQNDKTTKAGFSNTYGIDLVAPGYVSTAEKGSSNAYTTTNGTSFSAPLVTAAIALYKQQNPTATPSQIESALYASCDPVAGNPDWAGHGTLNVDKFLRMDAPTSISITNPEEDEITIEQGDTLQIEYDVLPSNYDGEIEFVSEENIVSVSSTGLISADEIGVDIVTVSSKDYPDIHDEIYVSVVEPQASEDDKSLTIVENDFNSSYSTSANTIKNHTDGTIKYVNVADFNNGIQIKSGGTIYNSASLGKIKSIKLTQQGSSSYENLMVGFGDSMSEAQNAAKVALSTTGVSGSNKPYFYIVNSSSNTRYAESIIITYENGEPSTNYTVSFNSNTGSGNMSDKTTSGSTYVVPSCAFTAPSGMTFDKWALDSTTGTKYAVGSTISGISKNITLYATWKEDSGGGGGGEDTPSYWSSWIPQHTSDISTGGPTLVSALRTKISNVAPGSSNTLSYDDLWDAYATTDGIPGSNGTKIYDMYGGFEFRKGTDQAGSYKVEGDVYNREHSVPKSWFSERAPAISDLIHVVPTDGKVNGMRSNNTFGEVASASYSYSFPARSYNSVQYQTAGISKLGTPKAINGVTTTQSTVFEPDDQYKGDFARIYMYFAVRYGGTTCSPTTGAGSAIFTSTCTESNPYVTNYGLALLKKWHEQDPVSEKERTRNNGVEAKQGNRNPFVDYPEWADKIFGTSTSTPKVNSIALDPTSLSLDLYNKVSDAISASVSADQGAQYTVSWTSSKTSVATVSGTNSGATITAVAEGTTTITAKAGDETATCTVTVTDNTPRVTGISLDSTKTLDLYGDATGTLTPTVTKVGNPSYTISWSSSNSGVVEVDQSGSLTAKSTGNAVITASISSTISATCNVTVIDTTPIVHDVKIDEKTAPVNLDAYSNKTGTITLKINADAGAVYEVHWTSSNTSVATIEAITSGGGASAASIDASAIITAVGAGKTTITAKAGTQIASYELTVSDSTPHATGVSLDTISATLNILDTLQLNPTITPDDAINQNVTWSSSDSGIASVSDSGLVTAVSAGSATITVTTVDGGHTATCSITVKSSSQTAIDDAKAWAIYFINKTTTTSTCKASTDEQRLTGLKGVWSELKSGYLALSNDAKTAFCTNSDEKIKEALQHYQFIISKFNKDSTQLEDFVIDGKGNHLASSSRSLLNTMFSFENTGFIVAILSIIGVASIAVFVVYKRRKTY